MVSLGYNYRLSDLQCALAITQLRKLPSWVTRRQQIARRYDAAFARHARLQPLATRAGVSHGYHLYVIRLADGVDRAACFQALRAEQIGVNVHYGPVHLHPFYRQRFGTAAGECPVAEKAAEQILSLPVFPTMTDNDVQSVIDAVFKVCGKAPADPVAL